MGWFWTGTGKHNFILSMSIYSTSIYPCNYITSNNIPPYTITNTSSPYTITNTSSPYTITNSSPYTITNSSPYTFTNTFTNYPTYTYTNSSPYTFTRPVDQMNDDEFIELIRQRLHTRQTEISRLEKRIGELEASASVQESMIKTMEALIDAKLKGINPNTDTKAQPTTSSPPPPPPPQEVKPVKVSPPEVPLEHSSLPTIEDVCVEKPPVVKNHDASTLIGLEPPILH
jgi:hypothetical protein